MTLHARPTCDQVDSLFSRKEKRVPVAIGIHNALHARLVEDAGFDAIWLSSFEFSASKGLADRNQITMTEVASLIGDVASTSSLPIIVDAENGFGAAAIASRMASLYAQAGAQAICLDDTEYPKNCSLYPLDAGPRLVTKSEACKRVRAVRAAVGGSTVLLARTESLVVLGRVDEAVDRARSYLEAGADALFVQSRPSGEELLRAALSQLRDLAPVVVPMTNIPKLKPNEVGRWGASLALFPNVLLRASTRAIQNALARLRTDPSLESVEGSIATLDEIFALTTTVTRSDG